MENITKTFIQYNEYDQDGRYAEWHNFKNQNITFEEAMEHLKKVYCGFYTKVRMIEKTFNPETFIITTKTLRVAEGNWNKTDGVIVTEKED